MTTVARGSHDGHAVFPNRDSSRFASTSGIARPHERSSTVGEILKHQLLSERRFFGEFLGTAEPAPADVLPPAVTEACATRLVDLAVPRLGFMAAQPDTWWLWRVPFFDVERERVWIFWRRVLHTAHHRTQLTVYLRLLGRAVPATYGPTADVTWSGADPKFVAAYSGTVAGRGSDRDRAIAGVVKAYGPQDAARAAATGRARISFLPYDWALDDVVDTP